MPLSTTAKNTMLDALPDTVYAALFTGGAPGAGTEVTPATLWGAGNRPAVALEAATAGVRNPDGDATLGTVAVSSQAVSHIAYYDAATAGNLIGHAAFSRTLLIGDQVFIGDATTVFAVTDPA